jgi:hypothetical protein
MLAGHRGTVDSRGRVDSAHPEDGALREAACELALAARDAGYHGPCGVDAFVFRGPAGEPLLRPLVELNARFTVGTLAIASVRRAMPVARERFGLAPGRLVHFAFALEPNGCAAPPAVAIEQPGGAVLWLASEPGALDPVFAPPPT